MTTTPQSNTDPAAIRRAAEEIASVAGGLLQELYAGPLDVRYKARRGDRDPVTVADEEVERLVRREVAARFPGHAVLGEEAGGDDAAVLWVVDPLDGTANFANGLPIFACSIGVLHDGAPLAAAVYTTFGPEGRACVLSADRDGPLRLDGESWAPHPRDVRERARLAGVPAGFRYRFRHGWLGTLPPGETRSLGSIAVEPVLVPTREGRRWRRLDRFTTIQDKPLREWSAPVIAGDPRALRAIAPRLGVRRHPLELAEALIGYRRTRAILRVGGHAVDLAQRLRQRSHIRHG